MATNYALGLQPIKIKILSVNGVAPDPADTLTEIGLVKEGSTSINQEEPNLTKYKSDYDDVTFAILAQMGDFTLTTDVVEVDTATWTKLTGGTLATDTLSMPTQAPIIMAEVEVPMDSGVEKIHIHEGQVIASLQGQNVKTEMLALRITVTAMVNDEGDYVDIVFADAVLPETP